MSIFDNIKRMISPLSDEDDDYDEIFDDRDSPFIDDRPRSLDRSSSADSRRGKVVNIHATTQLKVVLVKPERFEAASEIADHLKEKRTVVVNLESTHKDIARRLIDFLSGVAYAGEGKIKKVAANTYIITPYSVDIQGDDKDEIGRLISRFGEMVRRLDCMVNEVYKSKIAQQQYELRALQAQINPHFLYNSLSLINWKAIMAGQEEIGEMSRLLSTFYRTTLNKGRNVTRVKGEWDNTCSYARIQNLLHSGRLVLNMELEEGMEEYEILNLLLQPLVENAIVHGLDHKTDEGEKVLKVTGRQEGEHLVFVVQDNGCGIPAPVLADILTTQSSGYGVQNVHHRIQLYYGSDYGLVFESSPGKGTRVTVTIPRIVQTPI